MAWSIKIYETPSGQPVLEAFLAGLQASTKAKVTRHFNLLEEFGPSLGMPHSKSLGGGLFELRVRGKQEVRIFYVFAGGDTVYLLHGFQKKTQSIPKHELDIARSRQQEIIRDL